MVEVDDSRNSLLFRLDSSGNKDTRVGNLYHITSQRFYRIDDIGEKLLIQPDGMIILAGTYDHPVTNVDWFLVRYRGFKDQGIEFQSINSNPLFIDTSFQSQPLGNDLTVDLDMVSNQHY